MGTSKDAERKIILELTELLRKNSAKVLSGETKLCLTTSSLGILSTNFRRYSGNVANEEAGGSGWDQKLKTKQTEELRKYQENIRTLFDFVIKAKALKIINGSCTIKSPVQIARFRSLQVLEVKKVPIHMIEGLSKLRGQLREIIVSKSLQNLLDVLEICGGDRSSGLVWSHLKTAFLSFNGLTQLDNSLRFVPFIDVLDLSHNSISKTEDYLQNVTDLTRINLGYNMLSAIPQFSHSNKAKLKTLVLRNNNLDTLEGVEELLSLEELDVTNNCIISHKQLHVLSELNRLQVLCLTGNPLCYKTNHRALTLENVSPQAGLGIFLLDGQRLHTDEITFMQQNHYKRIYANDEGTNEATGTGDRSTILSINGNGAGGTSSLFPPSPHTKKKKRGHRRMHSKERIPEIPNMNDTVIEESTESKSKRSSPTGSYVEDEDIAAQIEHDRKKIDLMRKHYGDDWLKALSAEQKRFEGKNDDSGIEKQEESRDNRVDDTMKMVGKDGEISNNLTGAPEVPTKTESKQPIKKETENKSVTSPSGIGPISPELQIVDTTDIYSMLQTKSANAERFTYQTVVKRTAEVQMTRDSAASWRETEEQYGDESEPIIVMLPSEEMKSIFVTVNNRYIIEKDTNGDILESLDLKCLQGMQRTDEKLYGKDIIGGMVFTVITLNFDYVRKDMRQRKYAMEDDNDANNFESLMTQQLKAKEEVKEMMECLKCKHEFLKQDASDSATLSACPKCKSKMIIKSDVNQITAETLTETLTTESKATELGTSPRFQGRRKAYKKSNYRNIPAQGTSSELQGGAGSLKEYVDRLIPQEEPEIAVRQSLQQDIYGTSAGFGTGDDGANSVTASVESGKLGKDSLHDSTASAGSSSDNSGIKSTSSWSDVRKSASQFATRGSVSSVESDITVLATNSRGNVSIISESSHEMADNELNQNQQSISKVLKPLSRSGEVLDSRGHLTESDSFSLTPENKGQVTPVGSPLSNSVCSSMVSSVYENTLAVGGAEGNGSGKEDAGDDTHESSLTSSSTDSVSKRHSGSRDGKKSRRSTKHRTAVIYSQDLDAFSSQNSSFTGFDSSNNEKGERSIYETADSTQFQVPSFSNSSNVEEALGEQTNQSIYDTVSVESDMSRDNYSSQNLSTDSSRSHGLTPDPSVHSSPMKRSDRSRSRSSDRRNRSGFYGEENLDISVEKRTKSDLLDFPSNLSPIKRKSSFRRSRDNRSAIFVESGEFAGTDETDSVENSNSVGISDNKLEKSTEAPSEVSTEDSNKLLPWEQEERNRRDATAGDKKDESLVHDEFVNIDHRIQLYLELHVFKADEICQCAIQCNIVQYMNNEEMDSLMVISTDRILLFKVDGELDSNATSDWLKCYEDQPITELQYIDIGLGYQSLRLEFDTVCSSYTLLIADEARCKKFLTLISGIVQSAAMHDHSRLEGISKSNPNTIANLEKDILQSADASDDEKLVKYFIVKYMDEDEEDNKTRSLVVTTTNVVLIDENHQWPLPRLQAPLSESIKGRQFTIIQREKINNIESLMFNEYNPKELRLTFFENSDVNNAKPVWMISMVTTKGVKAFVDAIREPWEEEFGVSLDITPSSFTDPE